MSPETATYRHPGRTAGKTHLPELDALRGVAAFIVLLNHFHEAWLGGAHPDWIARPRLNPALWLLVDGHASVILFFLLSGFVLTLPRLRASVTSYPAYVIRRICRIYLPYLAVLLLAVPLCGLWGKSPAYGSALSGSWYLPPDGHSFLRHLLMVDRFDHYRYDGPVWSLVHEMRISLLFPCIAFCALRWRVVTTFAAAAACTVAASLSLAFLETGLPGSVRMTAWSLTLSYCGIFLLGSGLALRYEACTRLVNRLGPFRRGLLLTAALVLYLYPPPAWRWIDAGDLFVACGGVVLLTFSLREHGMIARALRLRPTQFLGRISYSLYLLHFPVLLLLARLHPGRVSFGFLLVPYLTISIVAAAVLYRLVEVPCMVLGRHLASFRYPGLGGARANLEAGPQTLKPTV